MAGWPAAGQSANAIAAEKWLKTRRTMAVPGVLTMKAAKKRKEKKTLRNKTKKKSYVGYHLAAQPWQPG
jgi:hypothetical protein